MKPGIIIIIAVAALLLFGVKRLPELGRATGQTLKNFKESLSGNSNEEKEDRKDKE